MKLIVLTESQRNAVDTESVKGVANVSPVNTYRYNVDKRDHIEAILGDASEYIVDATSVVMWAEE